MYTFEINTGRVLRDSDGVQVLPADWPYNDDTLKFLAWRDGGNAPTEVVAVLPVAPADIQRGVVESVQALLDGTAQAHGYESILSAVSYRGSAVAQFDADGAAFAAWRDAVWAHCYKVLALVQAGQKAIPSADELVAELPPFIR